jgi:hypothetical protein
MSNAHAFDADSATAGEEANGEPGTVGGQRAGQGYRSAYPNGRDDLRVNTSLEGLLGHRPTQHAALVSATPIDDGTEPVDITPEPTGNQHWQGPSDDGKSAHPSRRRMIIMGAALVVGLAGAAGLGAFGWQIVAEKDATLDAPAEVAGLTRDDSERARTTADYLRSGFAADIDLDRSIGAVYTDPADAKRSVLLFGGTALLWRPERDLNSLFDLMSDDTGAVAGLREVPAGELGGVMKCGTTSSPDGDIAVCGWADHGSTAMAMFPGRSVNDSAALLRDIRATVQTRN